MPRPPKYDYPELKTQFVSASPPISLRELARQNNLPENAHKAIALRAREEGWAELRERRVAKYDERVIALIADREAARRLRRLEVEDNALEAIDEAITKMRSDMQLVKKEQDPETKEWYLRPAVTYRPEQVVQLMDRISGFFDDEEKADDKDKDKPQTLTQINFGSFDGSNPDHRVLATAVVEATRPARGPSRTRPGDSPLPYAPGAGEDE